MSHRIMGGGASIVTSPTKARRRKLPTLEDYRQAWLGAMRKHDVARATYHLSVRYRGEQHPKTVAHHRAYHDTRQAALHALRIYQAARCSQETT